MRGKQNTTSKFEPSRRKSLAEAVKKRQNPKRDPKKNQLGHKAVFSKVISDFDNQKDYNTWWFF